jgi:hypothetical protein
VIYKNTSGRLSTKLYPLYFATSAFLLAFILLIKQLTIFSSFSIGLLLVTDLLFHSRSWKTFLLNAINGLSVFIIVLIGSDFFLRLKPPYLFHYIYIWQEGIFQKGIISGNGFNVWILLGGDMWGPANVPIFSNIPLTSPGFLGQVLFLIFVGFITLSLALFLKKKYSPEQTNLNREILLCFILHLAMINLCFNLFLTGTRNRYLFHFYPYIIIAWVGLSLYNRLFSEKIFTILILGASLYGIFMWQFISTIALFPGLTTYIIMLAFHLILFFSLLVIIMKYQNFSKNSSELLLASYKSFNNLKMRFLSS